MTTIVLLAFYSHSIQRMDQVIVSTASGLFAVDVDTGNLSFMLNDSAASIVCPVGTVGQGGPLGTRLICCPQSGKGLIHYWRLNASTGQPESNGNAVYKCSTPEKFTGLVFSSCGGLMFAGSPTGTVYCWQTYTGALLRSWTAHFGAITKLILSSDDSLLFTGSEDSTVKMYLVPDLFDSETSGPVPEPKNVFSGHSGKITDICLSRDRYLITASSDKSIKVFEFQTSMDQVSHVQTNSEPTRLSCSTLNEVFFACTDGSVHSFSIKNHSQLNSMLGVHSGPVTGLALSLDGSRLVSCGESDGVKIWDTQSLVLVKSVLGPNQQVKNALGLLMVRKLVSVPDAIDEELCKRAMGSVLYVNAVDTYLQLKPLQRTLTRIESIDVIPLIRTLSTFGARLPKVKNGILINKASVEEGAVGLDPLTKAQNELQKQKELCKKWASAFNDVFSRLSTLTESEPVLNLPIGEAATKKQDSPPKKQRR